jgi:hypothetical protein
MLGRICVANRKPGLRLAGLLGIHVGARVYALSLDPSCLVSIIKQRSVAPVLTPLTDICLVEY